METPIIISIEANIGAGKSTVLEKLQTVLDPKYTTCIQEPIDYWNKFKEPTTQQTILSSFYSDPIKYAFPLQVMIYSSLHKILEQTIEQTRTTLFRPMIITERSLSSCSNIFTKMLYENKLLNAIEYQVYRKCIATHKHIPLHLCIYLKTTPAVCLERINTREKDAYNQPITLEYLQHCHNSHESWLKSIKHNGDTIIHVIDVDCKTPDQIVSEILEVLSDVSHI
jgi:deoxyadenosine/deoxycytidine kinase